MPSIFKILKDEKKLNSVDGKSVWEKSNHNFEKSIQEIMMRTGLEKHVCINKLTKDILENYPIASTYYKFNYDIDKTSYFIHKETDYDIDEIKKELISIQNMYDKNDKKNKEIASKNKEILDKRRNEEAKKSNIYKSSLNQQAKMIESQNLFTSQKEYELRNDNRDKKRPLIVSCPKCGSTSITTTNKKISVGKGAVGAVVGSMVNPVGTVVGAAVGATHSKKIYNVCMNCGHRWKP